MKEVKATVLMSSFERRMEAETINVQMKDRVHLPQRKWLKRSVAVFTRIDEDILILSNAAV